MWQLGSLTLTAKVRSAAELIIGNLNDDGYLTATDEELLELLRKPVFSARSEPIPFERGLQDRAQYDRSFKHRLMHQPEADSNSEAEGSASSDAALNGLSYSVSLSEEEKHSEPAARVALTMNIAASTRPSASAEALKAALKIVHQLDPIGIGARDLRECLLLQIAAQQREAALVLRRNAKRAEFAEAPEFDSVALEELEREAGRTTGATSGTNVFEIATHIVSNCLSLLQKKDMRELTRSCGQSAAQVQAAVDYIRTLDPRPGQRFNQSETRLIEPDVAFVKRDGIYVVLMNDEEMPTLRLNQGYRKMLRQKQTEKDVREYVKERYKSAIQLLRNIEQRKNTIVRTCEVIVRRQADFLEHGESALRPMMIKEVAEEIGVHPSTVSRAVANKYVHTTQGVYELRFFFSEGVNGPEGGDLPLVLLKRKVKKLIEDEDPRKPLTDDQLAAELQRQGIQVTRRTVAKYREDMQIPSTHQRRVR